jgi:hypothetical protein
MCDPGYLRQGVALPPIEGSAAVTKTIGALALAHPALRRRRLAERIEALGTAGKERPVPTGPLIAVLVLHRRAPRPVARSTIGAWASRRRLKRCTGWRRQRSPTTAAAGPWTRSLPRCRTGGRHGCSRGGRPMGAVGPPAQRRDAAGRRRGTTRRCRPARRRASPWRAAPTASAARRIPDGSSGPSRAACAGMAPCPPGTKGAMGTPQTPRPTWHTWRRCAPPGRWRRRWGWASASSAAGPTAWVAAAWVPPASARAA